MEPTVTDVYDGKNLGDYVKGESNWTDEQLAQAPLTGETGFYDRVAAFKKYIESVQPYEATSGITWANTRVGAEIYCKATFSKSNNYQITYTLFTYCDDTGCTIPDCSNINCTGSTTAKQDIIVNYDLLDKDNNKVTSAYQATIKAGTTGTTTSIPIRENGTGDYLTVNGKSIFHDSDGSNNSNSSSSYDYFVIDLVHGKMTTSTGDNPPMYVIEKVDAIPFWSPNH
jgi:hypothetical protein